MRAALFMIFLVFIIAIGAPSFAGDRISGHFCYTLLSLSFADHLEYAKKESCAMALRRAIESYKIFVSFTRNVADFELKKDIVEAIASGCVDNIRIIKQEVVDKESTVCTELVAYVDPEAVKSIISRKIERIRNPRKTEISNEYIKILNYQVIYGNYVSILYQAKTPVSGQSVKIIIDCFDKNGMPMEGESKEVPEISWGDFLSRGEVRRTTIPLPVGAASFEIRLD